ncbi:hypothetical protein [Streptomyces capillispiralis]|uniref:Uncharacterized protein n=1 Tax=Streptomyces capillispiralis TaxID=68182 RepID=A0A561T9G1_9ACTN|nr:hypothetical protein [Streptomyces capillispiralis]TWF83746.1 hypothetical protein FHX78_11675 [Streptomyces capillispiralis]GHH91459.1 hypothetical protein GCM10017779_19160 [Streptomyces capillispiralis]
MTPRPSAFRRATAGVVAAGGPVRRPPTVVQQRHLPLGRRLLVSLLGVRVRPERPGALPGSVPEVSGRRTSGAVLHPGTLPAPAGPPAERYAGPDAALREDRITYERLLDQALTSLARSPETAGGPWPGPEQLRGMALNAREAVMAAAAAEYQHFLRVRAERLGPSTAVPAWGGPAGPGPGGAAQPAPYAPAGTGRRKSARGVSAVLLGAAALTLLLLALALGSAGREHDLAGALVTAGLCLASVTAGLVLTAPARRRRLRRARRTVPDRRYDDPYAEVERARLAWHTALLERGILPFLRQAIGTAGGPAGEPPRTTHAPPAGHREPGDPDRRPE